MPRRVVIADAGPLHYLVLIGCSDILSALFEKVLVPTLVRNELVHREAPEIVRAWMENPPDWLEVRVAPVTDDPSLQALDDGERAAIALAVMFKADLILMDDRAGVAVARAKGFAVTGTLGLLDLAARRQLLKLDEALARLKATNFRYPLEIMDALLVQAAKDARRNSASADSRSCETLSLARPA
jgi:predicted nucleic acid-binding protein